MKGAQGNGLVVYRIKAISGTTILLPCHLTDYLRGHSKAFRFPACQITRRFKAPFTRPFIIASDELDTAARLIHLVVEASSRGRQWELVALSFLNDRVCITELTGQRVPFSSSFFY